MKATVIILAVSLFPVATIGQTMYKCPDPAGVVKYQQMPCSPTGGGEAVQVKPIQSSGGGLRPSEMETLDSLSKHNEAADKVHADKQAKIVAEEKRQEELNVEREKAEAMREQAAAIRALGGRY